MVKVGIVGPGILWETRYLPALMRMSGKISVCAVYDPVAVRGEQVAADLKALPMQGMLALAELPGVQAILMIDAGWAGRHALEFLCRAGKPVYIAGTLGADRDLLNRLHQKASASHLTLMPEFTLRHTPATARLHELMATKLGRPRKVTIQATPPAPHDAAASVSGTGADFLVGLLDWCRYVIRTAPVSIEAGAASLAEKAPAEGESNVMRRVRIEFARSRAGGVSPEVEVMLREPTAEAGEPVLEPFVQQEVVCEKGQASIRSASEICWKNGSAEPITEVLTADRSAVEVMLDHFCRRVVGGLIPVADIGDVCRGVEMARAVEESLRSGRAVSLEAPAK